MLQDDIIHVDYTVYASEYKIRKHIPKLLERLKILSFDTEVRSVYEGKLRKEASDYLKEANTSDELYKQARVVAESSGLSFPSIVKTTHFIFGESRDKAHVVICTDAAMELHMWKLVADYEGKLLVHNSLFDLKIMYERIGRLPKNFVDTALLSKCLINHVNIWKAKTGLKVIMGGYYPGKWSLMNDYEPRDLKDKDFLLYCAIDGGATFYLYELILEELSDD